MANLNVLLKNKADDNLYPQTRASLVLTDNGGNLGTVEPGAQVNKIEQIQLNGTTVTPTGTTVNLNVESGAQVNKIEKITVNGTEVSITNKTAQISVITQQEVEGLIAQLGHLTYEVVTALPTTGEVNVIYLVPAEDGTDNDIYDQYMYVNNTWEKIGNTEADLSGLQSQIDDNTTAISTLNTTTIPNLQTQIDNKMNAVDGVYYTTIS